nr:PREDICTED: uncharacterized protein LOC108224114 [Daucus carota subsp. sativus]
MKLDDYVLYKIYKNKSHRSKNATFDGEANNLEEDEANDLEEGEANDQFQEPFEYFHDGVAQQENIHQDHGVDEYMVSGDGHFNQVTHVDNTHEIDYSANQQQQQLWPVPYPNYLGYNSYMIPNHVSMVIPQMHGNGFYDQNRELMLHETLYNQQHMARDYTPPETMLPVDASNNVLTLNNVLNIPQEFCAAMSPVDASNNVQALPNISTEFSAAMSPVDASNNVQALSNVSKEFSAAMSPVDASDDVQPLSNISREFSAAMSPADAPNNVQPLSNISQEFSAAMPPVDAPDVVRVVKNELNIPQMQEGQYHQRPVMTRPSTSSTYHPYHHPDHPNN